MQKLIAYASISGWAQPNRQGFDPQNLVWKRLQDDADARLGEGVSMLVGSPEHPRLRRPPNSLSVEEHEQLAAALAQVGKLVRGKAKLLSKVEKLRDTLSSWMALETGRREQAEALYFTSLLSLPQLPYLPPLDENRGKHLIAVICEIVQLGYDNCAPKTRVLKLVQELRLGFERWMLQTRYHWNRLDQKLQMDSIGLVAIDVKHELSGGFDGDWKAILFLDASQEAKLVAALRPLLFEAWKEEDELEGYPFDPASPDSEQSILDHLSDLKFYRYVGPAKTLRHFMQATEQAFFFEPEHIWFKQKRIGRSDAGGYV
tara:strand:+ start:338 stop:1285 length:948 start_codon:yes stop_codon:yes gene_type:complete